MKRAYLQRTLALILTASIITSLFGCGTSNKKTVIDNQTTDTTQESAKTEEDASSAENQTMPNPDSDETLNENTSEQPSIPTEDTKEPNEIVDPLLENSERDENGLTAQQRNSFSMLYYLAITAEDIRISKNNRLILNDIFTSLLNDINPGAIDETTQDHLKNLRDIIKSYMNISIKRERLQYIYNQDKAATIRSAVPNPLAILSMTNALDWKKLAISVVYTVVDSYSNYKEANKSVEQQFLMSGWELDDKETATIQKNRERAFDYMVDIVQEYDLDGKLTLNEDAIGVFAKICNIDSVQQKIRRLTSEKETYKYLGNYWLELADCYFQTSEYEKCIDCVECYANLSTGIYRDDYNYVKILPKAIVAAQNIYSGDEYVSRIKGFTDSIIENTDTSEWSVRYFAAQVYLDLYSKTNDKTYLEAAYNIAYDNVTILLDEQRKMNSVYLKDVKELSIQEPDYRFMNEKEKKKAKENYKKERKQLKAYNESLKNERKTELSSLYEPLILNCDLLFGLADEMNISAKEKKEIEDILQTEKNGVFLVKPVNDYYSFKTKPEKYNINLSTDRIVVPANLLCEGVTVSMSISEGNKTKKIDDFIIQEVEREKKALDSFNTIFTSSKMDDYKWTKNSRVTIKISSGDTIPPLVFKFKVVEFKDNWILEDKVVFGEL